MARGSIRRPVFLYALVVGLGLVVGLVTLASFALVRVAQRGMLDAAQLEALDIARSSDPVTEVRSRQGRGRLVAIAWSDRPGLGVTTQEAEQIAKQPDPRLGYVSVPLARTASAGAYVVVFVEGSEAMRTARNEIRSLLLFGGITGLVAAFVLALLIGRLVLVPLSALERFAADAPTLGMDQEDTPHEVAEVAQTFQRTLRQLKLERDTIARQHKELARMQQSLVRAEKLASIGRLAAGVAHEIGNPLAAVLGYLSLLRRGLDEASTRDVLERSSKELGRMHETIKKLLTYARQDEAGEVGPVSTRAILEDTTHLLRGHPALSGVAFEVDLGAATDGPDALGRSGPIGQIVVNLVVNAAQATRGQTEAPKVTLSRRVVDDAIEVEVADNGPGIPDSLREEIFDPFFTTKSPGEGTGLGLAVSRALAEAMGAELSLLRPKVGARFVLRLVPVAGSPLPEPLG
ncbi:MAG: HAMP domain-containing histidine kinase [Deltaproteobacteria bacterium]|nr:HAMP domain-containing histidine kinase [Deltaproteobacteria bacterium]